MRVTEHAAQRLALRGITVKQAQEAIKTARERGDVLTRIRVIVEEDKSSGPKLITAYPL